MHWLKTEGRDLGSEIIATKRQSRVLVRFKRFPELRGMLKGIVLDVMVKGDPPDTYIFAKDCLALYDDDEDGFYCAFCDCGEQSLAPDRAALHKTHLYEPFRKFVMGDLSDIRSGHPFLRLCADELGHGSPWKKRREPSSP